MITNFTLEVSADIQYMMGLSEEKIRRSSALFLLKLKEQRRISQVTIDDIMEGSRNLISQTITHVQAGVRAKLADSGLDPESVTGLDEVFEGTLDPFNMIDSGYLQEKYYCENLGLIVSYYHYI